MPKKLNDVFFLDGKRRQYKLEPEIENNERYIVSVRSTIKYEQIATYSRYLSRLQVKQLFRKYLRTQEATKNSSPVEENKTAE